MVSFYEVFCYLCRLVCAPIVHDDAFEILESLLLQSLQSLQQEFRLVIAGYDDAYFRHGVLLVISFMSFPLVDM